MAEKLLIVPSLAVARSIPGVHVDRRYGVLAQYRTDDGYLVLSNRQIRDGAVRGLVVSRVVLHMDAPPLTDADRDELMPALITGGGA
ncbi:hypothetical protein ACJ5H2_05975 [Nocardioides sp. R1-1]|uniref:hypothetical protein n=1 Tax=Nocardioides sp. R1-1 TaxID=3383502 RepID=UPI0038D1C00B